MKGVKFKRFSAKAIAPKKVTLCSAGHNLFLAEKVTGSLHRTAIVSTNIDTKSDCKLVGKIYSHSSLSVKSIEVGAGIINSDYRGIIYVVLSSVFCSYLAHFNLSSNLTKF